MPTKPRPVIYFAAIMSTSIDRKVIFKKKDQLANRILLLLQSFGLKQVGLFLSILKKRKEERWTAHLHHLYLYLNQHQHHNHTNES